MKQSILGFNDKKAHLPMPLEAQDRSSLRRAIASHPKWPHWRAIYEDQAHIENLTDEDLVEIASRLNISLVAPRETDTMTRLVEDEERRIIEATIREGRLRFSPDLAQQVLTHCNYKRQRDIDPAHVGVIATCMRSHLWLAGSQIAFAIFNGHLHLVNGQHRLLAQVDCGKTIEHQVIIHPCESEDELKSIYWRFDSIVRVRSRAQIIKSAAIAQEQGVRAQTAKAVLTATAFVLAGYRPPSVHSGNKAERRIFDKIYEHSMPLWGPARVYDSLLKRTRGPLKNKLLTGSVATVALSTLLHQPDRAKTFWKMVADDNGLTNGQPAKALVNYLTAESDGEGFAMMQAAAMAWNAHFSRRSLQVIRRTQGDLVLAGTPIGGAQ